MINETSELTRLNSFVLKGLKDEEVVGAQSIAQEKLGETLSLRRGKWQCTYDTKLCVCAYVCLFVRLLLAIPDNRIVRIYLCIVKRKEVKSRTKPYESFERVDDGS